MKKLFCRQPKLLIVIELKLAEILGVCAIPTILYGMGIIVDPIIFWEFRETSLIRTVFSGYIGCLVIALFVLLCFGIYHAIKANWAWASRLSKK